MRVENQKVIKLGQTPSITIKNLTFQIMTPDAMERISILC
jgi:hypothetical protein